MNALEAASQDDHLFTLRVPLSGGPLMVHAFDQGSRIELEASFDGFMVFPYGFLRIHLPRVLTESIDGIAMRLRVLRLLAMKPHDADAEYFAGYSGMQLDFAERYGEELFLEALSAYGDEDGNPRTDLEHDRLEYRT